MSLSELQRRLDRLVAAQSQTATLYNERYATDPVKYAHEVLGIDTLTPDQVSVLRHAASGKRIRLLVPSGNETGKSFIAAVVMSWHYDCFRPSLTITTAPAKKQVDDIIFRELRKLRRGDPGFSPKASNLTDGPDHLCYGYTAKDATAFHGRHDASVMVVFDEAEGIDQEFWEAAESFADIWICFYNPTKAGSAASIAERSKGWRTIRMSALNHPNVRRAELGMPAVVPNAVTLAKVLGRLEEWRCTKIDDPTEAWQSNDVMVAGQRWRLSPVAEARLLGQRPSKASDAVYSAAKLEALRKRTTLIQLAKKWQVQIGCDVAHYGDDYTVMHVRQGPCSIHHESHNGWGMDQIERRLRELAIRFAELTNEISPQDIPVLIDAIGVGAGIADHANGFNFINVNTSRTPDEGKEIEYPNLRSQIAFDFESLLHENLVDMSRLKDEQIHDIVEQFGVMTYELGIRGQRIVHPKKIIKERLGRSPDDADAVLLAYYQFPDTLEVSRR